VSANTNLIVFDNDNDDDDDDNDGIFHTPRENAPPDSPSTLSTDSEQITLTPASTPAKSSSLSWEHMFGQQLQAFAARSELHASSPRQDTPSLSPELSYESDRTDFLPRESPCPKTLVRSDVTKTLKRTKSFTKSHHQRKKKPVVRKLDYGFLSTPKKQHKKLSYKPITENGISLQNLRDIEGGSPRHFWTNSEHELLCILNRFYQGSAEDFAQILNKMMSLNLSVRRIKSQFHSYIRLHGAEAFTCYGAVFSCSPDDPHG
jgi:hypothetical protein